MEFMIRGRAQGKTHALVERFVNEWPNAIIVCHSAESAKHLAGEVWRKFNSRSMQVDIQEIKRNIYCASSGNLVAHLSGRSSGMAEPPHILVDNIDLILQGWFRAPIEVVTATGITA